MTGTPNAEMDSCDVLIIGGGPAGSSCAWALRRSGLDVAVLDKQKFPRDKVCGGWITPEVLKALEIDPAEYSLARVLQPITSFRVGCIGAPPIEADYGSPVSYGIRRCEFDDYLLRRSGARLLLGNPLTRIRRSGDGWIANGNIAARVLVGAGGHFCPVARLVGRKADNEPAVVAQEIEFRMDSRQLAGCGVRPDTPELYFCPDMKGYGWCFRKGDILNVGLGRADPHGLPAHVASFLRFLKNNGSIYFDVPPLQGHAYLLNGTSTRQVVGEAFLLIGDSAGLAYPHSGEGIRPAVESGLLAAKIIIAVNGAYDGKQLEMYRTLAATERQQRLMNIGRYLPSPIISALSARLLNMRWFVRNIILNRCFLHAS